MEFSITQFEEIIDNIDTKLREVDKKIDAAPGIVSSAIDHWWITDAMEAAIKWAGDKVVEFGKWLIETITDLLKGVAAPVYMSMWALDWLDIRGSASQVAGNIDPNALKSTAEWQGAAQFAYKSLATAHNASAKRISDIGKDAAIALGTSAVAGFAFYGGVLAVVVKAAAAVTASLGGIASGVFSWAGAALIAEEAIADPAMIVAAVTGLTAVLGAQVGTLVALKATATDNSVWTNNGKWPDSATSSFDNGTRLDGTAEWSIR
ncbi:hypothetical protein [Nocardia suismassiliense]|uniref:hypothetical protein n=1 Tax=Nocardia suismassiliense TaxID=2077092 RepID=UPI000D1E3A52|nr:hypothetical protein [Nocardia suismassiliense]